MSEIVKFRKHLETLERRIQELESLEMERQRIEFQLKSSLEEKELLLKEIHHRVKNNMAVISSFLNLQATQFKDRAVQDAFADTRRRIRSMALVHEQLCNSGNLAKIYFPHYMEELAGRIAQSREFNSVGVEVEINADKIYLGIDTAVPCGMLINELLANAFKYAFPNGQGGKILLSMKDLGEEGYRLEVSDNGVGIPEDLNLEEPKSFGLQLVNLLGQQLNGLVEIDRSNGTRVSITFKTVRSSC